MEAMDTTTDTTNSNNNNENSSDNDPLTQPPSTVVREGDYVILYFADGRQLFVQCLTQWKGKSAPLKLNKRSYSTASLLGLEYGSVLEVTPKELVPLPGEDLLPAFDYKSGSGGDNTTTTNNNNETQEEEDEENMQDGTFPQASSSSDTMMANINLEQSNDNRNLVDNNTSQSLDYKKLSKLVEQGTEGSAIVSALVENSKTFHTKTEFSKAKYIARKQKKYQLRCRIVRCTPHSICETMFKKDPRRMMNLREDTLGQILSYSNVSAGCQVLVLETCMGVITGSLAQRMGGYGKIVSIYEGQQPSCMDMLGRFNLTFPEQMSVRWVHTGDVFGTTPTAIAETKNDESVEDPEKDERLALDWPCPLQSHTRAFLENMKSDEERKEFLAKRCARFARKLTRATDREVQLMLAERQCDSIVLASRFDPTSTLIDLLPYLAPSSPFVVYCEYMEPLTQCFRELQKQGLAINIRLMDTWMREYQVLPGRTHPNMNMSQSGGFLLTGIKLDPVHGHNELDEELLKELKETVGGRRGKRAKYSKRENKRGRSEGGGDEPSKRSRN